MGTNINAVLIVWGTIILALLCGCDLSQGPELPTDIIPDTVNHSEDSIALSNIQSVREFIHEDLARIRAYSDSWQYNHSFKYDVYGKTNYSWKHHFAGRYSILIESILKDASPFLAHIITTDSGTFERESWEVIYNELTGKDESVTTYDMVDTAVVSQDTIDDIIDTSRGQSGLYTPPYSLANTNTAKYFLSHPEKMIATGWDRENSYLIIDKVIYDTDTLIQYRFVSDSNLLTTYLQNYGVIYSAQKGSTYYTSISDTYYLSEINHKSFDIESIRIIDSDSIGVSEEEISNLP